MPGEFTASAACPEKEEITERIVNPNAFITLDLKEGGFLGVRLGAIAAYKPTFSRETQIVHEAIPVMRPDSSKTPAVLTLTTGKTYHLMQTVAELEAQMFPRPND